MDCSQAWARVPHVSHRDRPGAHRTAARASVESRDETPRKPRRVHHALGSRYRWFFGGRRQRSSITPELAFISVLTCARPFLQACPDPRRRKSCSTASPPPRKSPVKCADDSTARAEIDIGSKERRDEWQRRISRRNERQARGTRRLRQAPNSDENNRSDAASAPSVEAKTASVLL